MNILNWLAGDDALIDIPTRTAVDLDFQPSQVARIFIALVVPLGLPLLALSAGAYTWHRRRRQ